MTKTTNTPQAPAALGPFKKALIKKYQKKLEPLRNINSHISLSFANGTLNQDMTAMLDQGGFTVHTAPRQKSDDLLKRLPLWLYNNNTVLLHYRAEGGDGSLINLLRAIKANTPKISFGNLVPVFFLSVSGKKQMEILRTLGVFGIHYAMFLTPNVPLDTNIEEVYEELISYGQFLKQEKALTDTLPDEIVIDGDESEAGIAKLKRYQELIREGNSCMESKEYDRAITIFTEAVNLNPDCEALLRRGDVYFMQKQYVLALKDYRQASTLEQSLSEPYAKMSACCFIMAKEFVKEGESEESVKKLTLGTECIKKAKKKTDEFLEKNQQAPEKIPENPYAPIIETMIRSDIQNIVPPEIEKELDVLMQDLLKVVNHTDYLDSSVNIDVRINYALLLTKNREYEKAEAILRVIIKEKPEYAAAILNNFALELRKSDQNGKAFDIYAEILDNNISRDDIVIENLKTAGLKYGAELRDDIKMDEAIAVYKKVLEFRPLGREWVLCELAMTYLELQDQAQASFRLMEAIYINPNLMKSKYFEDFLDLKNLKTEMMKKLSEASAL